MRVVDSLTNTETEVHIMPHGWQIQSRSFRVTLAHLQGAIKGVLITKELIVVGNTVKPASIHQSLSNSYRLGPEMVWENK